MKSYVAAALFITLLPLGCDSAECTRLSDCAPVGVCIDGQCMSESPPPSAGDAGVDNPTMDLGASEAGVPDAGTSDAETPDLDPLPGVELESTIEVEWLEGGLGTLPPPPGEATLTLANRSGARFQVEEETWSSGSTTCVLQRTRVLSGEVAPVAVDSAELLVLNSPLAPFPLQVGAVFSTRTVPPVFDVYDSLGFALAGSNLVEDQQAREAAVLPTVPPLENLRTSPSALLTSTSSLAITWVPTDDGDAVELRIADEDLKYTLTCRALPFDGALEVPQGALAAWFALNPTSSEVRLVVFYQAESEIEELDGPRYPLVFRVGRTVPLPLP